MVTMELGAESCLFLSKSYFQIRFQLKTDLYLMPKNGYHDALGIAH